MTLLIVLETGAKAYDGRDTTRTSSSWSDQLIEYKSEMQRIKEEGEEIHEIFNILDLLVVEETYEQLTERIHDTESRLRMLEEDESTPMKNEFFDRYESMLTTYNKLINLYEFYRQLEERKEQWSDEYFSLWEQTYALKTRIDKMYVKEEKMNVHYGGMSDYKYQSVRRRNIYEACSGIFNAGLLKLKSTGDCDHYERIQILNKMIPLLRKCEKLSYTDDTRELEKELRREDDMDNMAELILNFDLN
jgi:hypothetical protein